MCGLLRLYAEVEFYTTSTKLLTMVGLTIMSIVINAGGGPEGDYIDFKHVRDPGPFVQYRGLAGSIGHFIGFFSGLTTAAFPSIGAEMLAWSSRRIATLAKSSLPP